MKLTTQKVESWLKGGGLSSIRIVVIYGEEEGKVHLLTERFIKELFSEAEREYGETTFEYNEAVSHVDDFAGALVTDSLFNEKRVVVVKNCKDIAGKPSFLNAVNLEELGEEVLLILTADSLKKTAYLRKHFENRDDAAVIACYKDSKADIARHVAGYLTQHKARFEPQLPGFLAEILPSNLMIINNELDKLILYRNGEQIRAEDVEALVPEGAELSLDALCVAVSLGDNRAASTFLTSLNQEEMPFMMILRSLIKYQLKILSLQEKMKNGLSAYQVVADLKPPVFFQQRDNLIMVLNKSPAGRAKRLLKKLIKLEVTYKSLSGVDLTQALIA
jgi:DNA polymerase-3 subunit delta